MSGICGVYGIEDKTLIKRMLSTLRHRGPDGENTFTGSNISLGCVSLNVDGLHNQAEQLICNGDGNIWICSDGGIYNSEILKAQLQKRGYRFESDTEDEVIIHCYEEYGMEFANKLRGSFALALWDNNKKKLILVRDSLGEKPLYYSFNDGVLTFASEIKALLKDMDQKRAVHEEAFYHFLSFLTTPAPQTLFDGVKKLFGGTWIRINENGDIHEERYWDIWDYTEPLLNVSEEEIAHLLLEELRSAVKFRKVSDVPVGVFLSGGIDSSVNTALFSEGEGGPVKTFCIGYDRDYDTS